MNFFVFVVELVCMVSSSLGFTTPDPSDNFDSVTEGTFSVYTEAMTLDGTCVCQINSPKSVQCTSNPDTNERIDHFLKKISQVSARVDHHTAVVKSQGSRITTQTDTMMATLDKLEQIESGNLVVSRPEFEVLRLEIADMESLLLILNQNQTKSKAVVVALETEIANITGVVNSLEDNGEADIRLLAEIKDLKQRLRDCQENQENDGHLLETWYQPADQDTCRKIKSVSSPHIIRGNGVTRGTWFRDPLKHQDKVYSFSLTYSNRYYHYVDIYSTLTEFHDARTPLRLRIPNYAQGTGMVAYNGSLFFQIYNNLYMGKYDIELQRLTKVMLPSDTLYNNNGAYLSDSYSDIDFAVDESGLWVIYSRSSSNKVMIISKVDPETLALTKTWTTSVRKSTKGNCFVICQVLYCTDGFNSHTDKIRYYFDTKTSTESFLYVPIDSRFLATYALSYNPYDQKLYGWDNGHQVVYGLSFEENE